jgi:type I restriction enzyme S subunit
MLNDWKFTTLGAEADLISGFPFRSNKYTDDPRDVRLLRGDNIVQGNIRWVNAKRWSIEDAPNFEQYELKKDDVVLAMDRPWIDAGLKYAAIDNDDLPCLLLQRTTRLRGGPNLDIRFLRYVIGSPEFTKHIQSITTGSLVPHISSRQIKDFVFRLPPLATQERIAAVLSALDAKIALNHRINSELEGMAKLLYDYWFVQYDFPLSAAQAAALGQPHLTGQPYRSAGGPMVFDPQLKREIPKGWELKKLCDIESNIITGKTPPTADPANFSGDVPFICIGDVRGNMHIVKTELTLSSKGAALQQNKFIPKGAICVTCIASPGLVGFATKDSQTNQQLNTIVCENEEHRPFLYFFIKDYFINSAGAKTGNTFANMNKGDFSAIPVVRPDTSVIRLFSENVEGLFALILNNSQQNQELTTLRDWLLPMLMNGQVRVG